VTASAGNLVGTLGYASGMNASTNLLGGVAFSTAAIDPLLSPLGYHGGGTQTMTLLSGSLAINHGRNDLIPLGIFTDQRDAARILAGIVDIGAVEGL
jgi:hypothetical protein